MLENSVARITAKLHFIPTRGFLAACGGCVRKLDNSERAYFIEIEVPKIGKPVVLSMRYCADCAAKLGCKHDD